MDIDGAAMIHPEKVLAWRDKMEWLVHWKGVSAEDATRESELLLKSQFPDLSLEDEADIDGRGKMIEH